MQPVWSGGSCRSGIRTLLALVEDWWAGVVLAYLVGVRKLLAATLMDALLSHCEAKTNSKTEEAIVPS